MYSQSILIKDTEIDFLGLSPLISLRSFAEVRTGCYSLLERISLQYNTAKIFYSHPEKSFVDAFLSRNPQCLPFNHEAIDIAFEWTEDYLPWNIIYNTRKQLGIDFELNQAIGLGSLGKVEVNPIEIIGERTQVFIHPSATIYPGVLFDGGDGPIFVDEHCIIFPYSSIKGPAYIGKNCRISNVKISDGTIIGNNCNINGEISQSVLGDFNVVHNQSTINSTYTGNFVHIGAFCGTSNLKLDYSNIDIMVTDGKIARTPYNKLGSVLSDFCSLPDKAICNPGTTIELGCMLDKSHYFGYNGRFSNNSRNGASLNDFVSKVERISGIHDQEFSIMDKNLLEVVYSKSLISGSVDLS